MNIKQETIINTTVDLIGEEAIPLIKYLRGKKDISEFKIAEDIDYEIHLVRNLLYRLNSYHLATYIRKKDKIKGWYISYWTLNPRRFKEIKQKTQLERVEKLKQKLKKEQEYRDGLYICPNLCVRFNFDKAMEISFKCPECGRLLHQQDNSKTIKHLKSMIEELEVIA